MTYQVLARKWRPRVFSQMVGQEHVLRALINALDNNRLHHAFLFTGTRGVGKTTLARILAKSLNCEVAVSSQPCGQCSACREIDDGRFVDLLELDAASHTGIDNMRDVLDNAQYLPTRGRYKVYLIDEVHMLSKPAFNSMLKTLEEPPPHVKFILATTDPQKIPVTVLSRCLQFNLKRLAPELITKHLDYILLQEVITSEPAALLAIARAADGSLRDALSLLDQAIAYGAGALHANDVNTMLGTIAQDHIIDLLNALAVSDAEALLNCIHTLAEQAPDFSGMLNELLSFLHRIALAQALPDAVDDALGERATIIRLAETLSPEDVQLFYQIGLIGQRDLPFAPDPRSGFEMILLRMLTFRPTDSASHRPTSIPPVDNAKLLTQPAPVAPQESVAQKPVENWLDIVQALNINALPRQLAMNCALNQRDGNRFHLVLDGAQTHLLNKKVEERLQQALRQYFDAPIEITITIGTAEHDTPARLQTRENKDRRAAAVQALREDPIVQSLCETFNARIDPDSVQVTD